MESCDPRQPVVSCEREVEAAGREGAIFDVCGQPKVIGGLSQAAAFFTQPSRMRTDDGRLGSIDCLGISLAFYIHQWPLENSANQHRRDLLGLTTTTSTGSFRANEVGYR